MYFLFLMSVIDFYWVLVFGYAANCFQSLFLCWYQGCKKWFDALTSGKGIKLSTLHRPTLVKVFTQYIFRLFDYMDIVTPCIFMPTSILGTCFFAFRHNLGTFCRCKWLTLVEFWCLKIELGHWYCHIYIHIYTWKSQFYDFRYQFRAFGSIFEHFKVQKMLQGVIYLFKKFFGFFFYYKIGHIR
jgi:hypothetical protein